MDVELVAAGDAEYPIVANLARFYMYDMAEHAGWPFEPNGDLAVGDIFDPYWGRPRPSRAWPECWQGVPFLARIEGNPAGFALVVRLREAPPCYDMGEFFVARQYRRHGIGRHMAAALFERFPGEWIVRELLTNRAAQIFWRSIIADYTGGNFTEAQERFPEYGRSEFVVQRFDSRR
jgi:ribosomal-protein-alanine N-acetyltransferase